MQQYNWASVNKIVNDKIALYRVVENPFYNNCHIIF